MNRSQLVDDITRRSNLSKRTVDTAVNTVFDTLFDALCTGSRVEIRGFGSFTTREYGAYTGRNPKTGVPVDVRPKRLPYFKVGKDLRRRIDG